MTCHLDKIFEVHLRFSKFKFKNVMQIRTRKILTFVNSYIASKIHVGKIILKLL